MNEYTILFDKLIVQLPLCALATWQIVECWWHGSVFAELRAKIELQKPAAWTELLLCPFCLSHWVSLGTVISMELYLGDRAPETAQGWFALAGFVVLKAFVVTRLAQVANDLSSGWSKTPNRRA